MILSINYFFEKRGVFKIRYLLNKDFMKNSLIFIVLALVATTVFSCEDSVSSNITIRKTRALSVENVSVSNNLISLIAISEWNNGCGSVSHYTLLENQNDILIVIYGEEPKNATCTQAFIQFEAPVEIIVDGPGEYNLHFWQNDSTSLDTTIVL